MVRTRPRPGDSSARRGGSPYPKVEFWPRLLAKAADALVALLFAWLVPAVGVAMAVAYLLFCDALPNGQSPGKRLLGVKVVHVPTRQSCTVRPSVIRNLPVAIAAAAMLANTFLAIVALPIVLFELYMAYTDALGIRIGDVFADTQVVDAKIPLEAPEPVGRAFSRPVSAEVGETVGAQYRP
jgi:uncharacterized RDD family membrane protein YckC